MQATVFGALGEPSRFQIVELLRGGPFSVSDIAEALSIRQPQVSKHLRVLSEAGIVTVEPVARRRIYHLDAEPFGQISDWVDSFERLWEVRLDSLDGYLNSIDKKGKTMADKTEDDVTAVLEKIEAMAEPFKDMGRRLHEVIMDSVPTLVPRVWYGMPGYAKTKSSPVLCFFRADEYMSFGLTEKAHFTCDDESPDHLIESAWFLTDLDEPTEMRIAAIVKQAVG